MSEVAEDDLREYWSTLITLMGLNKKPPKVKDFVYRSWSRPNAKLAASINRQEGFIHVNVTLFGVDTIKRIADNEHIKSMKSFLEKLSTANYA